MTTTRQHSGAFRWMRAIAFAVATGAALGRAPFYPTGVAAALALAVGVLGLVSPGLAVPAFVVALGVPLLAADPLVGIAFLVVGLAAVRYLAADGARPFLVIALAFLATSLKIEWAVVALAGYVLGVSEGATAALIACAAVEVAGILLGAGTMGATATGGSTAAIALREAPADALSFAWLMPSLRAMSPSAAVEAFRTAGSPVTLILQPLLWAAGAGTARAIGRRAGSARVGRVPLAALSSATGVAVIAVGSFATTALGIEVSAGSLVAAAAASTAVAAIAAAGLESLFPPSHRPPAPPVAGVEAEDADVDELLSLIASAEEEIAAKHTTDAVVMITDMKSFSAMTEEEGSVISAKRIQRHRDLLLPIISAHGGCGKSTGGDGLVASFREASGALSAAVEMQQALDAFNAAHPAERPILVRIGLAFGEVVLDRQGRPFIGTALNKAARVMNLGDGGRILASADVIASAGRDAPANHALGAFQLKNIADEVEVLEVVSGTRQDVASGE